MRPSYVLPVSLKHVKREDRLRLMNKLGSMSKYLFTLLICVSLLTGCGKQDNRSSKDGSSEPTVNWKEAGFVASEEVTEEQGYWIQEFVPWKHGDTELDSSTEELVFKNVSPTCTSDGKIYRLNAVINPPDALAVRWILGVYDTEKMESSVREIHHEQLGLDRQQEIGFLVDMAVIDDSNFIFQWAEIGQNEQMMFHQSNTRMIYSDLKGNITEADLWDKYLQEGIAEEEYYGNPVYPEGYCVCDGEGNTYVKSEKKEDAYTKVFAFDRNGQVVMEYQCGEEQGIEEPMRMEGGEPVFPVYDYHEKTYTFVWLDTSTKTVRNLGQMNSSKQIERFYGSQGNTVYYKVGEGIVQWNIRSGDRRLVFHFQQNGLPRGYESMLVLRKDAPPVIRMYRNKGEQPEDWLIVLSDTKVERDNDVRIADLGSDMLGSQQVSECATIMSRKDLNCLYSYETGGAGTEDFRTKIMAELAAGDGPDILFVSEDDMEILRDKGLLADLREYLSQDTLDQLLPGVIEMGTREEQLVGLAGNVMALGLAVSRDVWKQDTWTLEDVISLMESGRLESSLYYTGMDTYFSTYAVQNWLMEYCLENSFLIDWEKRQSHFQDERLIQLLDLTDRGGKSGTDESGTWLGEGNRIALFTIGSESGILKMVTRVEKENGFCVGFPTNGSCGNYLEASGMIVVNANSNKKKEIAEYLENFFGEEIQGLCKRGMYTNLSVCKLTGEEASSVEVEGLSEEEREQLEKERAQAEADRRLAEAFLESCVPAPRQYPELNRIIEEELGAMAEGDKDARQVAEIIHKRIQIFLDEGYS